MNASEYVAWYGAAVATAVVIWDFVKWKKDGPQVKAEAHAGWATMGMDEYDGKPLTLIKVTNTGSRPTTISSLGMYWYPKGVSIRNTHRRKAFIIKSGYAGFGEVPKKIGPGDVWQGAAKENDEYNKMLSEGRIYIALGFSHKDKEILVQVTANNAVNKDAKKAPLFRRLLP